MMRKIKAGIIGCGTIGGEIAKAIRNSLKDKISLAAVFDIDKNKINELEKEIGKLEIAVSIDGLIQNCDLVIEAASAAIAPKILTAAIAKKKDIMIMSTGGLLERKDLFKAADEAAIKIYLPSGAVSGIDALKAAAIGKIKEVVLTTKKPPRGLEGAPYILEKNIDLNSVKGEIVIFEGSAARAVKAFPKNINVSAVLSLAGIGAEKTKVKIIASSLIKNNIHQVVINGDFGTIKTESMNVASEANPKTSMLAVLSAIATLKGIVDSVRIGT